MSNRLSFLKSDGIGQVVLMIHGNSSCKESFLAQIQSPIFENYELWSIDLPGHGQSARSQDYSLESLIDEVEVFVHEERIQRPVLVGHSLGGHIAIGLSRRIDIAGLMIMGTPPLNALSDFPRAFSQSFEIACLFSEAPKMEHLLSMCESFTSSKDLSIKLMTWYKQTDPRFRSCFAASLNPETLLFEQEVLKQALFPYQILCFVKDSAVNVEYFRGLVGLSEKIDYVSEAYHFYPNDRPDDFNLKLQVFLRHT